MVHRLLAIAVTAAFGIALLLISTNPEHLPAAVFVGLFIALYVFCYAGLALVGMGLHKVDIVSWDMRRIRRTALAVACLPVFLLILQSIGQLTARDILLTLGLFILLYLYFGRVFIKNSVE